MKLNDVNCAWLTKVNKPMRRTRVLQTIAVLRTFETHVDAAMIPYENGDPTYILDRNEGMNRPKYLEGQKVMIFGNSRSDMTIGEVIGTPKMLSTKGSTERKWLYEVKDIGSGCIHEKLIDEQILPLWTPGTVIVAELGSEERVGVIRSASYEGAGVLMSVAFLWWQENMGVMTFIDHKVTPAFVKMQVTKRHIITFGSLVIVVCIRYPF